MTSSKIGFICGSTRRGSINAQLTEALAQRIVAAGAQIAHIDLTAYNLPFFQGDLDVPSGVVQLKADIRSCNGIIMVTPEYNGSLPSLLKNAIDWLSVTGSEQFEDPIYAIAACTPGPMSGIMVLRELNYILTRIGADVVAPHVGTGNAETAFNGAGELIAARSSDLADQMIAKLLLRISQKG